jgi:hypothetical protein
MAGRASSGFDSAAGGAHDGRIVATGKVLQNFATGLDPDGIGLGAKLGP